MKSEFFCLLFYLDVQKIGRCLPLMGRAICLTQHIKSNADIFQKYSDKHTQECFSIHLKIFWLNWVYTKLTNASVYFKGLQHESRSFTELSLPHLKFLISPVSFLLQFLSQSLVLCSLFLQVLVINLQSILLLLYVYILHINFLRIHFYV